MSHCMRTTDTALIPLPREGAIVRHATDFVIDMPDDYEDPIYVTPSCSQRHYRPSTPEIMATAVSNLQPTYQQSRDTETASTFFSQPEVQYHPPDMSPQQYKHHHRYQQTTQAQPSWLTQHPRHHVQQQPQVPYLPAMAQKQPPVERLPPAQHHYVQSQTPQSIVHPRPQKRIHRTSGPPHTTSNPQTLPPRRNTGECWFCHSKGHYKRDCRKHHAWVQVHSKTVKTTSCTASSTDLPADTTCKEPLLAKRSMCGTLHPNNGLFLTANVASVNIHFLVDTGSNLSVIHVDKYNAMPSTMRPPLQEVEGNIIMGKGTVVPAVGLANFSLEFDNFTASFPIVVAKLEVPGVLGYDFLYDHRGVVDVTKNEVTLNGQTLQCQLENRLPSLFRINDDVTGPTSKNAEALCAKTQTAICEPICTVVSPSHDARRAVPLGEIIDKGCSRLAGDLDKEQKTKVHALREIINHHINPGTEPLIQQTLCCQPPLKRQAVQYEAEWVTSGTELNPLVQWSFGSLPTDVSLHPTSWLSRERINDIHSGKSIVHYNRLKPYLEREDNVDLHGSPIRPVPPQLHDLRDQSGDSDDSEDSDFEEAEAAASEEEVPPLWPRTRCGRRTVPPNRFGENIGHFI